MSIEEATQYLMNNYPVTQIAESLADLLLSDYQPVKPIIISEEDFAQHFRIKGITADGTAENRGRPKKEKPNDDPQLI